MKISLWQQFSSNNSSHFTIVGVFPSPEAAQQASEKVRGVMTKIEQWHEDHPEESENIFLETEGISEVESDLAQTYQIDWDQAVLWAWNYKLLVQDNVLVLSQVFGADSGAHPMDKFVQKLGAEVGVDGDVIWYEQMAVVKFEIACIVPSESVAALLASHTVYETNLTPIEGSEFVQVKLRRGFHFSGILNEPPELFTLIETLKANRCQQIEVKLTSQLVSEEEYDDMYEKDEDE